MAREPPIVPPAISVEALRLGVSQTYVLDELEAGVATKPACGSLQTGLLPPVGKRA